MHKVRDTISKITRHMPIPETRITRTRITTRITIKTTTRTMTRTMVTRVTLTPDMPTQATLGQVTGVRFTVRRLYAHTATIHTTRMRALRAATTVLSGSPAAYLLEQDRGSEVATMAGVSTGLGAITVVAASTDVLGSDRLPAS